jgi:hypothetical protein
MDPTYLYIMIYNLNSSLLETNCRILSMAEELFQLQLTLKKNSVNIARKYEEVDRLCQTFTNQIKKYMTAINNTIQLILSVLESGSINGASTSAAELPMVENEKLTNFFIESAEDITNFIETNFGAEPILSNRTVKFVLSYYHFFWSKKYCDSFAELIKNSSQAMALKLSQLLVFQPNVQMYIINVLRPIFEDFSTKQNYELTEIFYQNAVKYAPMLPDVAQVALRSVDAPGHVYWALVEIVMKNFAIFGVCDPEMILYINSESFDALIGTLYDFFNSDECNLFMKKVISCGESLSAIPSEEKLIKIFPEYVPFTLVSSDLFDTKIDEFRDIEAPKKELFFVKTGIAKKKVEVTMSQEYQFLDLVRKFLLKAALIKVPTEHPKAIDYFQALAELSSVYGDPDLEDLLDKLASAMPQDIEIEVIEAKLSAILESESKSEKENPLVAISTYSAQQAYLTRLTEYFEQFETLCKNNHEFTKIRNFMEAQEINAINSPDEFIKQYEALSQQYEAKTPLQLRGIFTCLGEISGVFNAVQLSHEYAEQDAKLRTHIASIGQELAEAQNHDWLEQFKKDKNKLLVFNQQIYAATKSPSPLQAALMIHSAYQDLTGLLMIADIGEIGADQLTPFAILAIANSNPPGLFKISNFLQKYVSPLFGSNSPLDHAVEYSVVQFLSTIKTFQDYLIEV